ncbi:uncharacterized protein LOC144119719 [Amblyomma americanum]
MHPDIHKARRKAKSEVHERSFARNEDILYVDAATYRERYGSVASMVDHQLREINWASIKTSNILEAEEKALAPAITHKGEKPHECRKYSSLRISTAAIRILKARTITFNRCCITWTPDHEAVKGNQRVDANARAYAHREVHAVTRRYGAILEQQRARRRTYSPPHKNLSSKIYPSTYDSKCPLCGEHSTLYHVTWACQKTQAAPINDTPTREQREACCPARSLKTAQADRPVRKTNDKTKRTAPTQLGTLSSPSFFLPNQGTLQIDVLCVLLINVVHVPLSKEFINISNLHAALCGATKATLTDNLRKCLRPMAISILNPSPFSWEATLRVAEPASKEWLVDRAFLQAKTRGLPEKKELFLEDLHYVYCK